jgi:hypothetical protein
MGESGGVEEVEGGNPGRTARIGGGGIGGVVWRSSE